MSIKEEITGKYQFEIKRLPPFVEDDPDYVVAKIAIENTGDEVVVAGPAEADELLPGVMYRFCGHWKKYTNKYTGQSSQTFAFETFVLTTPHTRDGIINYLKHAPNIGSVRAELLYDCYGTDAVKFLRENPEVAARAIHALACERATDIGKRMPPKLSAEAAIESSEFLARQAAMEDCLIGLIGLLEGRGGPKATANRVIKKWGNRAPGFIRRNPYLLMNFRGWGFKKTDAMYLDLKLPPAKLKRQALCAWYALASDTEGHTWHAIDAAVAGIKRNVAGAELKPEKAIALGVRHGMLAVCDRAGKRWAAEGKKAKAEARLAECIAEMMCDA